jgi:hypothetical protein
METQRSGVNGISVFITNLSSMGKMTNAYKILLEKSEKKTLGTDGRIIFDLVLGTQDENCGLNSSG